MRLSWITGAALAVCVGLGVAGTHAQQSSSSAATTRPSGDVLDLSATSVNVASPGIPVKIRIIRWSTDAERAPLIAALTAPPARAGRPGGPPGRGGGARGARGGAPESAPGAAAGGDAQGGGRAGAGRGGAAAGGERAAGGGARGAAPGRAGGRGALVQRAPLTPIQVLAEAVGKAPTVGYIWTNDVTGYSIRYAWHAPATAGPASPARGGGTGGERIILVTDRRLDMYAPEWKPAAGTEPADYEFTLIDIRLDARGAGVAKTSLTTPIAVDKDANTLALDDFAATPVLLQNVRRYQPKVTE